MFPLICTTTLVDMNCLDEARRESSALEKRCVYDVVKKDGDGDASYRDKVSRAYAICRSSLQRSGRMKKGTAQLTKMGAKRSSGKGHAKDHASKTAGFEVMLKKARESK